jgi:hypothetical protein
MNVGSLTGKFAFISKDVFGINNVDFNSMALAS